MTPTDSHLLLRAIVDELVRSGVQHAVTSPGSRNTPIIQALVRDPRLRCWSHIDERSAGFFALGAAKTSGRPVVITCTSGTALANLLPAVVEAHEAGVPLIVLSADRPPELRQIGAGQTIDQLKLFGGAVKWFFEVGVQEASPERLRWARSLACRVAITAGASRPGPVHLNIALREPLVIDGPLPEDPPGGEGRADGLPWVQATPIRQSAGNLPQLDRAVLIAGELTGSPALAAPLARFAARAGIPLLADPLSGARRGPAAIAGYDLILRDPATVAKLTPRVVCRIGELPTSKPLREWLASLTDAEHVLLSADAAWSDPASVISQRIVGPLDQLLQALPEHLQGSEPRLADPDWLGRWKAADAAVRVVLGPLVSGALSEPAIAATLGSELPSGATLWLGSSMPVRDAEEFFEAAGKPPRVLANRGANGIDGTVSAAFGAAAVSSGPVVLLIGDVALAHDIGGLLAARRTGCRLTIVLINNDGGGIFHFLPIASQTDSFEEHVATPHGLDFRHAAALYGCEYEQITDLPGFRASLSRALEGAGTTILEVRTDRAANRALHAEIALQASRALADT